MLFSWWLGRDKGLVDGLTIRDKSPAAHAPKQNRHNRHNRSQSNPVTDTTQATVHIQQRHSRHSTIIQYTQALDADL